MKHGLGLARLMQSNENRRQGNEQGDAIMTPKELQDELIKVTVLRLDGVISAAEAQRAEELLLDGTTVDASYAIHLAIEESGKLVLAGE